MNTLYIYSTFCFVIPYRLLLSLLGVLVFCAKVCIELPFNFKSKVECKVYTSLVELKTWCKLMSGFKCN